MDAHLADASLNLRTRTTGAAATLAEQSKPVKYWSLEIALNLTPNEYETFGPGGLAVLGLLVGSSRDSKKTGELRSLNLLRQRLDTEIQMKIAVEPSAVHFFCTARNIFRPQNALQTTK